MTKREAAIVTAYTGILIGKFTDAHEYMESRLKRPIWTHEFGNPEVMAEIKEHSKADFVSIQVEGDS